MKNVIILGASGGIAGHVIDILANKNEINLTLFLRNKSRLRNKNVGASKIIEGDVLKYQQLKEAIAGQDIVYVNLAGELEPMAVNIVKAMQETDEYGALESIKSNRKIIFISSIGIYDSPLKSVLKPYRKASDVIEASDFDYTILRPAWFTSVDEVDFETTEKGEPERGSVISQKSLAVLITNVIEAPEKYVRKNLGINKPQS
ncbi:NAD(P)H-binding protein [Dyadobacter sp. CY312]|uniref:NAD(P)H-binding protein n=1 Tax=Dyadobacter sp. CY312 TaxID=2907303 RepID=UPI001F2342D1|nr:NAD(P)H-binding protein [Dyadobacter sp. CY312]MCE7039077.1 NAD(P)H-binding protein [Dyadobacter sp. CY312]